MRLGITSDLHGHLPEVPPCDVLVIAGDVTPTTDHAPDVQAAWLDADFRAWLDAVPATHVVGIAGNHDFVFDRAPELVPDGLRWTYLQDAGVAIDGVRFWGSPWTPWFFDWAFNAPKGDEEEEFLRARWAAVPEDTDVLVIHGPPRGYGDRTTAGMDVGSRAELELVERTDATLAVFGHIHEARGRWRHGRSTLVNASAVDLHYQPVPDPVHVLDLDDLRRW